MAEVYGIFDYTKHELQFIATLVIGLKEDSRTKMAIAETKISTNTILLASITDYLALLWWAQTKDGQKGHNRPKSIRMALLGNTEEQTMRVFDTIEKFNEAREKILRGDG